jgi:hypothetical protein
MVLLNQQAVCEPYSWALKLLLLVCALQDDTYTESYISTIGVDFVSA